MSVGLMDGDFYNYILVPFNLEIMKLSAYLKKKKQIVVLSNSFDPDSYTKFIYRKDYKDGMYPNGLLTNDKIEYGGLAFSNNIYVPMEREIEIMKPDTSIYSKAEKILYASTNEATAKKIFRSLSGAEHCRLSLDGKTIWNEYKKQFKSLSTSNFVMFHDYDLGKVDGAFEEVKTILNKACRTGRPTNVGMKFPVQLTRGEDLVKWVSLPSDNMFYSIRFNGIIDDESFMKWIEYNGAHNAYKQTEYNITGGDYTEEELVTYYMPKIFRQILISRSCKLTFSLIYNKGYFKEPMWEKVIQLFNFYQSTTYSCDSFTYARLIGEDTLFKFARNCSDKKLPIYNNKNFTKQEVREIFNFVKEKNYPLFKDFYECSVNSLGGLGGLV